MATTTPTKPKDEPKGLGLSGDFRNLRTHGATSLTELKEFLATLRGKSPQEVIGVVSASLLIQSLGIATAITIVGMAALTIGPYLIWGPPKTKESKPAAAAAAASPESKPASNAAADAKSAATANKTGETPSDENTAKALKAMGMDETKTSDPKANPLEKDFDKLLDGVK